MDIWSVVSCRACSGAREVRTFPPTERPSYLLRHVAYFIIPGGRKLIGPRYATRHASDASAESHRGARNGGGAEPRLQLRDVLRDKTGESFCGHIYIRLVNPERNGDERASTRSIYDLRA
jgi:hypothetical protein